MMAVVHYHPGPWRAVVTTEALVFLPPTVPAHTLDAIHAALVAGGGFAAVLQQLTDAFGSSLTAIPPFAVAVFDSGRSNGALRLAVRGDVTIDVAGETPETTFSMSGADITTWSERLTAGATGLRVGVDVGVHSAARPEGERFRILSGIVLADSVAIDLTSVDESAPQSIATHQEHLRASALSPESTPLPALAVAEAPEHDPTPAAHPTPAVITTPTPTSSDDTVSAPPLGEEIESTRTDIPEEAYDHLWGETVAKSVESAAVREFDDDDEAPAPAPTPTALDQPTRVPLPAQPSAPVPKLEAEPQPQAGHPSPPRPPAEWTVPPATGLIDRVPDFSGIGAPAPAPSPVSAPDASTALPSAVSDANPTDHDGLTVTVSELEAMRRLAELSAHPADHPGTGPGSGSGTGSGSNPASGANAAPVLPPPGHIVLSTGGTVSLDRPLIVGRRPRANRVDAETMPTLVTVPSPEHDISRNHLEIRTEGRHVLAIDLDTTNGSVLHRTGAPPTRLSPLEPTLVLNGDVIDLGDGVTLTFEDLA